MNLKLQNSLLLTLSTHFDKVKVIYVNQTKYIMDIESYFTLDHR